MGKATRIRTEKGLSANSNRALFAMLGEFVREHPSGSLSWTPVERRSFIILNKRGNFNV